MRKYLVYSVLARKQGMTDLLELKTILETGRLKTALNGIEDLLDEIDAGRKLTPYMETILVGCYAFCQKAEIGTQDYRLAVRTRRLFSLSRLVAPNQVTLSLLALRNRSPRSRMIP